MPAKGATPLIDAPPTAAGPAPAEASAPAGIALDSVARAYRTARGPVAALDGVTLRVAPGEVCAVVGPSGCGKSTLLELVCGLQAPDAGTVAAGPAALMFQRDLLLPWRTALDNAALPLRVAGTGARAAREQARPLFAELGLAGFEAARPFELSGGMRQRVAFVRTLLAGRPVLALDEPFASLDALTRAEAQAWLAAALDREPRTVLLVTHDVEEAAVLGDRVVVLSPRPGRVVAEIAVPAPRPRRRTDPGIVGVREEALGALGAGA
jgi:ABC-type nitrate/sulfonate/bicarbonate transport system ATPase subunit